MDRPTKNLTKKEIMGFFGLIILAILVIYLGFRQMGNQIRNPFAQRMAASLAQPSEPELSEAEQVAALKQKDTDKDGLSDYDELYVYQTSPYLSDTDSDGVDDKTEIEKETDPNCPAGKDCVGGLITGGVGEQPAPSTGEQPFAPTTAQMPSVDQLLMQALFGPNPDPKVLREFLVKQGIDKKTLELFSDAELVQTLKDIVSSTSTPSFPLGGATALPTMPDLSSLGAKDLRQLLLSQGVSQAALDKISDEELLKMVKELK